MRCRVGLAVLIAVVALLMVSCAVLLAANGHNSHHETGAANGGKTNTCELCQKPIAAKSEAVLESSTDGSVHHYACIECALIAARDYFKGDVKVHAKSAESGAKIEWARHQGKWQASPASAVVMSLPETSGTCQQDHLVFKDDTEFSSYAKTHAQAAGHKVLPAARVDAILLAGKPPAPKETTCPVMGKTVHPTAGTEWTVYKGKTYYFCCAGCKPKFTANPAGYLSGSIKPTKGAKGGACGSHGDAGCAEDHGGTCGGASKPGPAQKTSVHKQKSVQKA